MFNRILVPLDGSRLSEQVLSSVATLARAVRVPVVLVHAVDLPQLPAGLGLEHRGYAEHAAEQEETSARTYLERVCARLTAEGIETSFEVVSGSPADAILEACGRLQAGLIAMSTHGRAGLDRLFVGSVADKVIHTAHAPLLVYRPRNEESPAPTQLSCVILPLDGSENAEAAIPIAADLAVALSARIVVARIVPTFSYAFTQPFLMDGGMAPELLDAVEQDAREYLAMALQKLQARGLPVEPYFATQRDPAAELVALAARTPGCLIAMSTRGHTGLGRWVLGSVTDQVVRESGSPVLLVRGDAAH